MRYLKVNPTANDVSRDSNKPWWCSLLTKILPPANPNLEQQFQAVHSWWLELDDDGEPTREIGFDANNNPIVIAPIGDNYGMLADTGAVWQNYQSDGAPADFDFEAVWNSLYPEYRHLENPTKS
ncbi:MAG: hypothetical protein WCK77_24355 [Verrucomicrobiota bacterium]